MRIGIDIDGVLTNISRYMLDYGSKYFFEKYKNLNINIESWSLKDMFNVANDDDRNCYLSFVDKYATCEPARPFASEIIDKFKEEGNDIYIITARGAKNEIYGSNKKMKEIVEKWLYDNKIKYDELIHSDNKLEICKKYNIDIMIEDKYENIKTISKEIPVICFHENYNKNLKGKNIFRAYSWYDVYYKYLLIKKNTK